MNITKTPKRRTLRAVAALSALSIVIAACGDDDDELVLDTGGLMNVRIKAEREDGRCVFSLRVSWADPSETASPKGQPRIEG